MIHYTLTCKSKHWPARFKKVRFIVENIIKLQKELKFKNNIDYNCNLILTDDKIMKKINYKFRNKNAATDVLTFVSEIKNKKRKIEKICDIFFSANIISLDAQKNKINFYNHLTHLIIHSFLHINGYIHDRVSEFNRMKKIEIMLLKKMGIANPYLIN
jgi:probable rRNA maturation factor